MTYFFCLSLQTDVLTRINIVNTGENIQSMKRTIDPDINLINQSEKLSHKHLDSRSWQTIIKEDLCKKHKKS